MSISLMVNQANSTNAAMATKLTFKSGSRSALVALALFLLVSSTRAGAVQNDVKTDDSATKANQAPGTTTPVNGTGTVDSTKVSDACKSALQSLSATLDAAYKLRSTAKAGIGALVSQINDSNASLNERLRAAYFTLQNLGLQNLPDGFKTQSDALDVQKTAVDKACDTASGKDAADQQITAEKTELSSATTTYNKGLLAVLTYAGSASDEICKQLGDVPGVGQATDCASIPTQLTAISNVDDLEKGLGKGLRALEAVMDQRLDFAARWKEMSGLNAISSLADQDSTNARRKVEGNISVLQRGEEIVTAGISNWLQAITRDVAAVNLSATSAAATVLQDPLNNSADGLAKQKAIATKLARVDDTLRAWPSLSVALQRVSNSHFDDIAQAIDTLRSNLQTMHSLASQLSDSLAGDMNNFVTESVRLFYFTDVKRLMTALSTASHEVGGLSEAREKAAQERTRLLQAELDLADAQAQVSNDQKQVLNLQEEQRQQSALVQAAQLLESKTGFNLRRAQQQNTRDNTELDAAKERLKESPNDPVLQKQVASRQKQSDNSAAKVQQVDSLHKDAQDKATQAADKQEASKADSSGIEAKIADARKALEAAQAQVQLQRRRTLLSADAESQAFAFARDNTPFFVSEPVGVDTDPVKRVLIFGFPDSASVLLRGRPEDVKKVKEIVATFDVPAPQARLTLWTFQLNATLGQNGNKSDTKKLNQALEIVDEELGNTRALVNTTLGLLRQEISIQVRSNVCSSTTGCSASGEKSARIKFFSKGVLNIFKEAGLAVNDAPDPAATTTLGEALLMLSLACDHNKAVVRQNFTKDLQDALKDLHLRIRRNGKLKEADLSSDLELPTVFNSFPLTWRVLGIPAQQAGCAPDSKTTCGEENISSSEFEILYAYLQEVRRRSSEELKTMVQELLTYNQQIRQMQNQQSKLLEKIALGQGLTLDDAHKADENDHDRTNLLKKDPAAWQIYKDLGKQATMFASLRENAITRNKQKALKILSRYNFDVESSTLLATKVDPERFAELLQIAIGQLESSYQRVRTAAADEMLKQFMIAVEDDLDRVFIQPMIYRLRNRLMTEAGVGVGIIERESLLATNRLVARVDPRATAQLQVGTETDLLGEAQQLAQLYFTVQSGGATALLGALNKNKREPPPEIYGVGTGNTFQVTPVFDPSGQALRFKFDYVSQTRITEPTGGTDPQLPRVERHTVNTEVQLSNLETREISRFEANSKIGVPERFSGGIPVLKDLPYGRARVFFPVIGWFVRHAGHDAAVQQSVIFGQTTMYPTIADLVQLLAADNLPGGSTDSPLVAPAGNDSGVPKNAPPSAPPKEP